MVEEERIHKYSTLMYRAPEMCDLYRKVRGRAGEENAHSLQHAERGWGGSFTPPRWKGGGRGVLPRLLHFNAQAEVAEKVDCWALGCILYSLCFGDHPFASESMLQASRRCGVSCGAALS